MKSFQPSPCSPTSPADFHSLPVEGGQLPLGREDIDSKELPARYLSPPMSRSPSPSPRTKLTDQDGRGHRRKPSSTSEPKRSRPHSLSDVQQQPHRSNLPSPLDSLPEQPADQQGPTSQQLQEKPSPTQLAAIAEPQRTVPPIQSPSVARRKGKAHVDSACANCKKAHLSCDVNRPCARCVQAGKEDTCVNVEHKKRGRPRLAEDRRKKQAASKASAKTATELTAATTKPPLAGHVARTDPLRTLRPLGIDSRPATAPAQQDGSGPTTAFTSVTNPDRPIAFLDFNLTVVKSNNLFRHLPLSVYGRQTLDSLVDATEQSMLAEIRHRLRQERDNQKQATLPPLWNSNNLDPATVPDVETCDVVRATRDATVHHETLTFRYSNNTLQQLGVTFMIARTTAVFVVLTLPRNNRSSQPTPPSPYTFHPIYPTSYQQPQASMYAQTGYQHSYTMNQPLQPLLQHHRQDMGSQSPHETQSPLYTSSSIAASLPPTSQGPYLSSPAYGNVMYEAQRYSPSELQSNYRPMVTPYMVPYPNAAESQWQDQRQNELQLPPISADQQQYEQGWDAHVAARWERSQQWGEERSGIDEERKRRRINVRELAGGKS